MKRLYYNINSNVWVKLTDKGKEIYNKHWDEILVGENLPAPVLTEVDGWAEFQMWDLMSIYGCHLYNGCVVPFETNIRFKADDLIKKEPTKNKK